MKKNYTILSALLLLLAGTSAVMALNDDELNTQGKLLAEFFVTGRGIVAKSLSEYKINKSEIGDKGFTPEIFATKTTV